MRNRSSRYWDSRSSAIRSLLTTHFGVRVLKRPRSEKGAKPKCLIFHFFGQFFSTYTVEIFWWASLPPLRPLQIIGEDLQPGTLRVHTWECSMRKTSRSVTSVPVCYFFIVFLPLHSPGQCRAVCPTPQWCVQLTACLCSTRTSRCVISLLFRIKLSPQAEYLMIGKTTASVWK